MAVSREWGEIGQEITKQLIGREITKQLIDREITKKLIGREITKQLQLLLSSMIPCLPLLGESPDNSAMVSLH